MNADNVWIIALITAGGAVAAGVVTGLVTYVTTTRHLKSQAVQLSIQLNHEAVQESVRRQSEARRQWLLPFHERLVNVVQAAADAPTSMFNLWADSAQPVDQKSLADRITQLSNDLELRRSEIWVSRLSNSDKELEGMVRSLDKYLVSFHTDALSVLTELSTEKQPLSDEISEEYRRQLTELSHDLIDRMISINQRIEFLLAGRDLDTPSVSSVPTYTRSV